MDVPLRAMTFHWHKRRTQLSLAVFSAALLFFLTDISFAATVTIKQLPSTVCGGTTIVKLPSATGGTPATIVSLPTDVVCSCGACSATGGCSGKCGAQPGTDACGACTASCGACPVCGDGACNGSDNCSNCPGDCGACGPPPPCGYVGWNCNNTCGGGPCDFQHDVCTPVCAGPCPDGTGGDCDSATIYCLARPECG